MLLTEVPNIKIVRWAFLKTINTMPNRALDRSKILCLSVPEFQRQVFKNVKTLSERSKEVKKKRRTKGASFLQNPAYNA